MNKYIINLKKYLRHNFDDLFCNNKIKIKAFGYPNAWHIYDHGINSESIIYSFGVGNDVSFEKKLILKHGCKIFIYDPSPTGLKTMSMEENINKNLVYDQIGIAKENGIIRFNAPFNIEEGSYRLADNNSEIIEFICKDLKSLMNFNNNLFSIQLLILKRILKS